MIAGNKIRVLIVDDHAILRAGLVGLLETQPDLEVIGEAEDGQRGVEMAHTLAPDVIVMDVSMPGVNGIAATHRISIELPDVRIVALTLHESAEMAAALRNAGAAAYLTKGESAEVLIAAIRGDE